MVKNYTTCPKSILIPHGHVVYLYTPHRAYLMIEHVFMPVHPTPCIPDDIACGMPVHPTSCGPDDIACGMPVHTTSCILDDIACGMLVHPTSCIPDDIACGTYYDINGIFIYFKYCTI